MSSAFANPAAGLAAAPSLTGGILRGLIVRLFLIILPSGSPGRHTV